MPEMTLAEPLNQKRRLALFLDGTTDTSQGNTNVWRARSLCAAESRDGIEQRVYYAVGVGTKLGEIVRGEVFGYGIDDQVVDAYGWLVETHAPGDEVFLFGFSRGAYAARALAGYISRCGLIKPGSPLGVKQLYERYRKGDSDKDGNPVRTLPVLLEPTTDAATLSLEERWMVRDCAPIPVDFIGVWDTVGSVSTAEEASMLTGGDHSFLDVGLRQSEKHVYHAMAIDENRAVFDVTLFSWNRRDDDATPYKSPRALADVEQRWFCGAHGDVGGGTFSDALSQLPLRWLLLKASAHGLDLAFKRDVEVDAEAKTGAIEDSYANFLGGAYRLLTLDRRLWREIGREPAPIEGAGFTLHTVNETIDASVFERWQRDASYRPENLANWAKRHGHDPSNFATSVTADAAATTVAD